MKLLYRVIMRRSGTDESWIETQDLRSISNLPAGTYLATAHNTLTGLTTGDDHTQYALLAGRTTGQTLIGSIDTDSGLTLRSTSGVGATGADIVFQTGNNGATEAMRILNSGNIGIELLSPWAKLSVAGSSGQTHRFLRLVLQQRHLPLLPLLSLIQNGFVGIGTSSPSKTLSVNGDLYLTGALYNNTTGAGTDGYVFKPPDLKPNGSQPPHSASCLQAPLSMIY